MDDFFVHLAQLELDVDDLKGQRLQLQDGVVSARNASIGVREDAHHLVQVDTDINAVGLSRYILLKVSEFEKFFFEEE